MKTFLIASLWTTLCGVSLAAGPECMRCVGAPNIEECRNNRATCGDNEECYLEKVTTPNLKVKFNAGCRSKIVCSIMKGTAAGTGRKRSDELERERKDLVNCADCCSTAPTAAGPCNAVLCGQAPNKTQETCKVCDGVHIDIDACSESSACAPNEVCYTGIRIVGSLVRYVFGCYEERICKALAENESHNKTGREIPHDAGIQICDACCKGDNCNNKDCFDLKKKMKPSDFTSNYPGPSATASTSSSSFKTKPTTITSKATTSKPTNTTPKPTSATVKSTTQKATNPTQKSTTPIPATATTPKTNAPVVPSSASIVITPKPINTPIQPSMSSIIPTSSSVTPNLLPSSSFVITSTALPQSGNPSDISSMVTPTASSSSLASTSLNPLIPQPGPTGTPAVSASVTKSVG